MVRSPCCDKVGLKKGPWTQEEDQKLLAYIQQHGHGSWRALPEKADLQRCGKSCRLRWSNYLRPDIKRGKFNLEEEKTIIQLHALLGNRWSAIATHLPKRTDNEIKNYWNTHLKKRLAKMGIDPVTHKPRKDVLVSVDHGQTTNLSHMAQWESARLEAEARLVRESKLRSCSIQKHVGEFGFMAAWNNDGWPKTTIVDSHTSVADMNTVSETDAPLMVDGGGVVESADIAMECVRSTSGCSYDDQAGIVKEEGEQDWRSDQNLNNSDEHSGSDGGSGGSGSDYYEDSKNYWNNILNLVNSSSFDSPFF